MPYKAIGKTRLDFGGHRGHGKASPQREQGKDYRNKTYDKYDGRKAHGWLTAINHFNNQHIADYHQQPEGLIQRAMR
jgi:hypothetical protein